MWNTPGPDQPFRSSKAAGLPGCPCGPPGHDPAVRQGPSRGWDNARWSPLTRAGIGPVHHRLRCWGRVANGVGISDVRPAALAVPLRFRVGRQTHWLPGMDVRYGRSRCGGHGGGLPLLVGGGCSWWAHSQCAPRCQRPVCWALLTDPWACPICQMPLVSATREN